MKNIFDSFPALSSERLLVKKLDKNDIELIKKMSKNENVYKYTPTFIPEKQSVDVESFVNTMCDKLFNKGEEIVLGVYLKDDKKFCGIAELYHYDKDKKQISVGGRFDEEYWNKGIASEALMMGIKYLFDNTDIVRVNASNIVDNPASGKVLEKNGFHKYASNVEEDWGFDKKVVVDKWCLEKKD